MLLTTGTNTTFAAHILEDDTFTKHDFMKSVFEMLIGDDTLPAPQRGKLIEEFCDLYPEEADQFTIEEGTQSTNWWEEQEEPEVLS